MGKYANLLLFTIFFLSLPILVLAQAATTTENVSITVEILGPPPAPPPPPGVPYPRPTTVRFEGKAYPDAFITVLKDGVVGATFFANGHGLFQGHISGLSTGNYIFSILAEDTDGRKSVALNFTLDVLEGAFIRVSDIFLPPTIEIDPTQVEQGQLVNIFGQSFPDSEVNIFISPNGEALKAVTNHRGKWDYQFNTTPLFVGTYEVKAKSFLRGEHSELSQTLSFLVVPIGKALCSGADLNFDGSVDIIDFSILLYFWNQTEPENPCADINFDGIVDIFDFSIMMYWWTG